MKRKVYEARFGEYDCLYVEGSFSLIAQRNHANLMPKQAALNLREAADWFEQLGAVENSEKGKPERADGSLS